MAESSRLQNLPASHSGQPAQIVASGSYVR
jgi:hypothetical protein